ncbi:hypothetical protein [Desulforegula conservatrix]|uniref:hypothetical protein n=1 Tax=Desulforegula conservatrix TaxID=153026 RepID=UPI0003F8D01F|nr:hypothetical protein [Desulforegula conservatrix]
MAQKDSATLNKGIGLLVSFIIIFILIFVPVKDGKNSLNLLDDLYNQISKGSANYNEKVKTEAAKEFSNETFSANIKLKNEAMAKNAETIFVKNGFTAVATGAELKLEGNFLQITNVAIDDASLMYKNDGASIKTKYGYDEREVLYTWSESFKAMDKFLTHDIVTNTDEAVKSNDKKMLNFLKKMPSKTVECAYNYYKIEPVKIKDKVGMVLFSLIFYVIYTLWYGYAILYIFEGLGLETH